MVTAMDCRNWDEDAYRDSILLERESQCRTVFRTAFAPNPNPNHNSYPDLIVAAISDGTIASYSISSCLDLSSAGNSLVSAAESSWLVQGHDGPAYDVKFYGNDEDSLLLSCGDDGRIRGWKWKELLGSKESVQGLTAEEIASREPEEPEPIQMTDARCKRCTEKKVRLMEIIQAGHGDRYQLECITCGNTWYASRDEAASLTIDGPNFTKSVGTEPLATAKFEDVEKNLTSPRRADKGASDVLKKTTEAYMPVFDSQRSFNKSRTEDNTTTSNAG